MPDPLPTDGRIVLRPFVDADVAMLRDLATDPYLPLIGSLPADATEAEALAFIGRQHERLRSGVGYSFCVADLDSDAALGTAGLWLRPLEPDRAGVGYAVAPQARGRGVAVHALRALLAFGWRLPALARIEAYVEPANTASVRTAEAAGMRRAGLLPEHQEIGGRRVDVLLFTALRDRLD